MALKNQRYFYKPDTSSSLIIRKLSYLFNFCFFLQVLFVYITWQFFLTLYSRIVQQDNAFSRLMAPKGKLAKENAVPQNDNVPTAINVVNQEPPASTTSITTNVTTSEVATPKTKLNTSSQWDKIFKKYF